MDLVKFHFYVLSIFVTLVDFHLCTVIEDTNVTEGTNAGLNMTEGTGPNTTDRIKAGLNRTEGTNSGLNTTEGTNINASTTISCADGSTLKELHIMHLTSWGDFIGVDYHAERSSQLFLHHHCLTLKVHHTNVPLVGQDYLFCTQNMFNRLHSYKFY